MYTIFVVKQIHVMANITQKVAVAFVDSFKIWIVY